MYITSKLLAARVSVSRDTIVRDIRLGLLKAEKQVGIKGFRIPVTGKGGANDYLRKKYPGSQLIDP